MERFISRTRLRAGVGINYSSMILTAAIFLHGEYRGWNLALIVAALMTTAIVAVSFAWTYVKTGLWKLVHTDIDNLDERETQLTHQALRRSYQIFTAISTLIFSLLFFLVRFSVDMITFRGHFSLGLVLVLILPYLINTLPASIIATSQEKLAVK
ncbi:MAG: hypothetical protein KOO63_12405 [Bacteroidales bacterium]|nr:hypothetical protein [Candidatus Latescibacterota bacterium]